ncbi:arginine--tRNA ligase [Deinococcus peraridilitoris]|uniref:arginine--tRNA ligase n=1 Tax=Deinococcus peraridilitoris (strain DSM 19664 / LMG 22246 / CIP 109416 / KR-200) TaxID=937777 RepID=L0A5F5_DEIPD|nr:arginine--tRNA ligase [Deinococcus peraridilitoris]AFZ69103.1 arginyl-tRNA synthetase [Deinococcus peraridilitoris DSM 19664]
MDVKAQLKTAVEAAAQHLGASIEAVIQETPPDKPGDYGTPAAFLLAKALRQNPAQIAQQLAASVELPATVARAEAVGPYLNFFLDAAEFVRGVVQGPVTPERKTGKVIVEHTSVNPNKELHVGHLRNVVLGDSMARIFRAAGYPVEVQNYVDDTGRQAAESIFARRHYGVTYSGPQKYDHWLGELYVKLNADPLKAELEGGIREVMHQLEAGELRDEVEDVLRSNLQTCYALGAEYDLLVWESDIVGSGFLQRAMDILEASPYCSRPTEGKYAGAFVMDMSEFIPGLEDPMLVLQRSDGTATYTAKDIAQQFWKYGLFEGLKYREFEAQPSGKTLWTSHPAGEESRRFAHASEVINVIDDRQSHPQTIVKAALAVAECNEQSERSVHLAYGTVLLEGQTMSGRKGITLSVDEVLEEAQARARAVLGERELADAAEVARVVGIGALRFAMLKSEPTRQIDFRWDQALALQGDTAPVIQYAAVRAGKIVQKAREAGFSPQAADWSQLTDLETGLARVIARSHDVLESAVRLHSPHVVAQYALDLAGAFNAWYNHKNSDGKFDTNVMASPAGLREARLALVERMHFALVDTLGWLGIDVPAEM